MKKILILLLAAILAVSLMRIGDPPTWTCAVPKELPMRILFAPEDDAPGVGNITANQPVEVHLDRGDWKLVIGYGVDAQWRNARMSGWVQASKLNSCQ